MSSIQSKLVNLSGNITGTLPIANGGTGQVTAAAAFSALSPVTTTGDIIYSSSGTTNTRLGIGTNGKFLRAGSSIPGYGWNNINTLSSAGYTITDTDGYDTILVTTGASNRTITLPVPTNNTGRPIYIKKVDSGTGFVLITRQTSGTIDGLTTVSLYVQNDFAEIICDGTNWFIVSINQTVMLLADTASNAATTSTPFKYTNIVSDTSSSYSGSTGVFTVPVAGTYTIEAQAYAGVSAFTIYLYVNGTQTYQGINISSVSNSSGVVAIKRFAVSDTIDFRPDGAVTANAAAPINKICISKIGWS